MAITRDLSSILNKNVNDVTNVNGENIAKGVNGVKEASISQSDNLSKFAVNSSFSLNIDSNNCSNQTSNDTIIASSSSTYSSSYSSQLNSNLEVDLDIRKKIDNLIKSVNDGLYDKENIVKIAVLAVLAGQNIFLYGPPGTAKSMLSRKIAKMFKDPYYYFEHLMHRFCTPEELFGPISLTDLKRDIYNRKLEGYLAAADFAFLDEIWKSSPAVLNTLLTLLNEHKYHNGNTVIDTPLKSLISASNEIPLANDGLSALYDRFLVRLVVNPIEDNNVFKELIIGLSGDTEEKDYLYQLDNQEYQKWLKAINKVKLSEECADAICYMRAKISEYLLAQQKGNSDYDQIDDMRYGESSNSDLTSDPDSLVANLDLDIGGKTRRKNKLSNYKLSYISDRRWLQTIKLVKASAFFNGQNITQLKDLMILKHSLWGDVDEISSFSQLVKDAIEYQVSNASLTVELDKLTEQAKQLTDTSSYYNERMRVCIDRRNNIYLTHLFGQNDELDISNMKISDKFNTMYHISDYYDYFTNDFISNSHINQQTQMIKFFYLDNVESNEVNVNSATADPANFKESDIIKIMLKRSKSNSMCEFNEELGCNVMSYTIVHENNIDWTKQHSFDFPMMLLPTSVYQVLKTKDISNLEIYAKVKTISDNGDKLDISFEEIFSDKAYSEYYERVLFNDIVIKTFNYNAETEGVLLSKVVSKIKTHIAALDLPDEIINELCFAMTQKGDVVIYNANHSKVCNQAEIDYVNHFEIDGDFIYWERESYNWYFKYILDENLVAIGTQVRVNPNSKKIFNCMNLNCVCVNNESYANSVLFTVVGIDEENCALILAKKEQTVFDDIWIPNLHLSQDDEVYIIDNDKNPNQKLAVMVITLPNGGKQVEITSFPIELQHLDLPSIKQQLSAKTISFIVSPEILLKLEKLQDLLLSINELDANIKSSESDTTDIYNKNMQEINADLFMGTQDKKELSEIYAQKNLEGKEFIKDYKLKLQNIKRCIEKISV